VSSLVLNFINIIILFIILRSLVYKPVKKYTSVRTSAINTDMENAQAKLTEADNLKRKCDEELAAAAEIAETEKRRVLDEAENQAAEIISTAEADATAIRESAVVKAKHMTEQMMDEMRDKIADLTIQIAGRVLEREVDKGENKDIIDKYFDRVG
jgi:F-type H+-transporting ATPase subunit b